MVHSLTRLAQHLTGLRGGTTLQSELIEENRQRSEVESDEVFRGNSKDPGDTGMTALGDLFVEFREIVGPELRSLTVRRSAGHLSVISISLVTFQTTCSDGLRSVRHEFQNSQLGSKQHVMTNALSQARADLSQRIGTFGVTARSSIRSLQDILQSKSAVKVENTTEARVDGLPNTEPGGQDIRPQQNDGPSEAIFLLYL